MKGYDRSMIKKTNIVVTGGTGLVGQHLQRIMPNAIYLGSSDYNLLDYTDTCTMMCDYEPAVVVHLAARVGGIKANMENQYDFLMDNLDINSHVIEVANGIGARVIAMSSTCIYPDVAEVYPMDESMIHKGPPQSTNEGYAIAKRVLHKQIEFSNQKFGTQHCCLIPCNLYGEHDNYDLDTCHFVSALLKKIHLAKEAGEKELVLWGTGAPLRQFMYAGDLAKVIKVWVCHDISETVNVATPEIFSIREIAEIALKACDAEHLRLVFRSDMPDGQYRKDVRAEKLEDIFPAMTYTRLKYGLQQVYQEVFLNEG